MTTITTTAPSATITMRPGPGAYARRLADALRDLRPADLPPVDVALAAYADARRRVAAHGGHQLTPYGARRLLTMPDENAKLAKGSGRAIVGLSLAPHSMAADHVGDRGTVCPWSTPQCRAHCVSTAGNGGMPNVTATRIARTVLLSTDPAAFLALLTADLDAIRKRHRVACRLNTFSDIAWETVLPLWWWRQMRGVHFYDYTKAHPAFRPTPDLPARYHLTWSYTPERYTPDDARKSVALGRNVAVVVGVRGGHDRRTGKLRPIPATWWGMPVVDGDRDDRRWRDPVGSVVLLRAKGTLPLSSSFVVAPEGGAQ